MLRHTFVTTMLDVGVDLRDVQIAARHADPRTTMRYDRARNNLDRHPNYILAAYMASGTGATIPVAKMDVRTGGTRFVCMEMQTPNGPTQRWFTGEYREVVENERLVYTESHADENGNVRTPSDVDMPEGYPMTTEVRVELQDLGGRTKLVLTHVGVHRDSPGAAGWTMALDKMAVHVQARGDR
jgi:uncharacterized protein YndB with AHSA1/START domain